MPELHWNRIHQRGQKTHSQHIKVLNIFFSVATAASWKSGNDADSTPFLSPKSNSPQTVQEIPKYLEIVYDDSHCPPDNDGYEIPRSSVADIGADWHTEVHTRQRSSSTSSKQNESVADKNETNSDPCSNFKKIIYDVSDSTFADKQHSALVKSCNASVDTNKCI